ncbi:MAG: ribonuclease P protein component [Paludibacteraceae bacterium]|nr:ribonuclease P protein component [Paludibacteraceae bacterium]
MSNTFPKYERLCGQLRVAALYKDGRKFVVWPLRVTYKPANDTQVLIWAPKSLFKHAVDRNHLRRQMREAWRLNKAELLQSYTIALNYMDKTMLPYANIEKAIKKAIKKLNEETDS